MRLRYGQATFTHREEAITGSDLLKRDWFTLGVTIATYTLGTLVVLFALGEYSSLDEMYVFIEVQKHRLGWNYDSFAVYVASSVVFYLFLAVTCVLSLILIRRKRPGVALMLLVTAFIILASVNSMLDHYYG